MGLLPQAEKHTVTASKGKQATWFFLEELLPSGMLTIPFSNLQLLPVPFSLFSTHSVLCVQAQLRRIRVRLGQSLARHTRLFAHASVCHPAQSAHLWNGPILPHYSWNRQLVTTDVHFASHLLVFHLLRQNCWCLQKHKQNKTTNASVSLWHFHCWGHEDLRFPSTCPCWSGVW